MAKINSLAVRKARGTMGGMVYAVVGGQSTVREKAAVVSNPRTTAQMKRRVKLANLVNLYKINKEWMKKLAFENRPARLSVYNMFVQANLNMATIPLTKTEASDGEAYFQPDLVFTKGSLAECAINFDGDVDYVSYIKIDEFSAATVTVGQLSQSIIDNNVDFKAGDQISFILMARSQVMPTSVRAIEFILNPSDTTLIGTIAPLRNILSWSQVGNDYYLALSVESLQTLFPGADLTGSITAAAMVHSRTENGATKVSTCRLSLDDNATTIYDTALTSNVRLERAIDSYGSENEPFLATSEGGSSSGGSTTLEISQVNNVAPGPNSRLVQQKTTNMNIAFSDIPGSNVSNVKLSYWYGDIGDERSGSMTITTDITKTGNFVKIASTHWASTFPTYEGSQVSDIIVNKVEVTFADSSVVIANYSQP